MAGRYGLVMSLIPAKYWRSRPSSPAPDLHEIGEPGGESYPQATASSSQRSLPRINCQWPEIPSYLSNNGNAHGFWFLSVAHTALTSTVAENVQCALPNTRNFRPWTLKLASG
jgi:hypothetical protein